MKKTLLLLLLFAFAIAGCSSPEPEAVVQEEMADPPVADVSSETVVEDSAESDPVPVVAESDEVIEAVEAYPSADTAEVAEVAAVDAYPSADSAEAAEEVAAVDAYPSADSADASTESADGSATVFTVDPAASLVNWYGFKPAGSDHTGTVNVAEGTLAIAGDTLQSGTIVLDMTSIVDTDLSGGMKAKLEDHLKSADFFGVDEHPTATLVIKSAVLTDANVYNVTADLTIKGITNEIGFPVQASVNGNALVGNAEITIDRSLWDVRFGSGSFFDNLGDDLISNDIKLTVQLTANS